MFSLEVLSLLMLLQPTSCSFYNRRDSYSSSRQLPPPYNYHASHSPNLPVLSPPLNSYFQQKSPKQREFPSHQSYQSKYSLIQNDHKNIHSYQNAPSMKNQNYQHAQINFNQPSQPVVSKPHQQGNKFPRRPASQYTQQNSWKQVQQRKSPVLHPYQQTASYIPEPNQKKNYAYNLQIVQNISLPESGRLTFQQKNHHPNEEHSSFSPIQQQQDRSHKPFSISSKPQQSENSQFVSVRSSPETTTSRPGLGTSPTVIKDVNLSLQSGSVKSNVCDGSPCGLHATCSPELLDRVVCECTNGFTGQPPDIPCKPLDTCSQSASACGENTRCVNILNGHICQCLPGHFSMNSTVHSCLPVDEDECAMDQMICGYNARCDNTLGSYVCTCEDGFQGDPPSTFCTDTNECMFKEDICGEHAQCRNTLGSFDCSCSEGYEGDPPTIPCVNIGQCPQENICGENASCVETSTGYECVCTPGHTGNGTVGCVPAVENACIVDQDCTEHAACYSCCGGTLGTCHCLQGFLQQVSACQDIDECKLGISICGPHTDCHNYQGGYNCTCSQGYQGQPPELPCTLVNDWT